MHGHCVPAKAIKQSMIRWTHANALHTLADRLTGHFSLFRMDGLLSSGSAAVPDNSGQYKKMGAVDLMIATCAMLGGQPLPDGFSFPFPPFALLPRSVCNG